VTAVDLARPYEALGLPSKSFLGVVVFLLVTQEHEYAGRHEKSLEKVPVSVGVVLNFGAPK